MKPDIPKKAPGQRLIKRMSLQNKWIICLVVGLILLALGFTSLSSAIYRKNAAPENFSIWLIMWIYSIIIIVVGFVFYGQAVRFKVMMDMNKRISKQERELLKQIKKVNRLGEILRQKEDKKSKGGEHEKEKDKK
jgi:Na+/melibiose symporter-like transporter